MNFLKISLLLFTQSAFTFPLQNLNPTKTQEFLVTLLNTRFSQCTLLFFQDKSDNSKTLDYIAQNTNMNYFNVKYSYPSPTEIDKLTQSLNKYNIPHMNITSKLESSLTLPLQFPITVSAYHKRSDDCLVSLMMITDLRPQFMKQIYNLLTPVYIPITRKDLDYYIFITKNYYLEKLLLMKELPARIKFKIGVAEDRRKALVVKSVCFFCNDGEPRVVKYPSEFTPEFEYFPDYVEDLNGKVLKVACPYIRARIEADPPYQGLKNARRGLWKDLLEQYLMIKFNFTYNMFVSTGKDGNLGGGGTGLMLPNGTWTGVTGDLISGKADLGVVTANTDKRIHYIGFTESFFDIGYLTFVTSEGSRVYSPLALLWPLDLLMWFCVFLCVLVAFAVFQFMMKAIFWIGLGDSDSLNFARRGMISKQVWTFKYQIQFVLTSILEQDCVMPTFTPLRTFVAIWLFFTLVVSTAYRTKLVSLLAFPLIEKLPQDFDQLVYSDYKVGFMKHGDSAYNTLNAGTDPVYVKLIKEMEVIEGFGLECLEKVVNEKYGCIAYDFSLRHLRERNLSEADTRKLVIAPAHTYNAWFGLSGEGRSIFLINFSRLVSYTRAFNLEERWEIADLYHRVRVLKREWWFNTGQGEKASKSVVEESDNLTLKHISGAFYVLLMLNAICTWIFCIELVHFHRERIANRIQVGVDELKKYCRRIFIIKVFKVSNKIPLRKCKL